MWIPDFSQGSFKAEDQDHYQHCTRFCFLCSFVHVCTSYDDAHEYSVLIPHRSSLLIPLNQALLLPGGLSLPQSRPRYVKSHLIIWDTTGEKLENQPYPLELSKMLQLWSCYSLQASERPRKSASVSTAKRKIELSETVAPSSGDGRFFNTFPKLHKDLICARSSMIYQERGLTVLSETPFWKTPAVLLCCEKHRVIKGSVNQGTDFSR